MINWKIETWEEIENVLEALEIDYMVTHDGNLVLHFEDFDVVEEKSKTVVDHVDHLFMEFLFESNCSSYKLKFSRTDVYYNKQE